MAEATTLYAIDFNTHDLDVPPRIHGEAFPRDSVSLNHGRPEVVREMGPLTNQPLRLDSSGRVIHIEATILSLKGLPNSFERIEVELDVYIERLAPSDPSGRGSGFAIMYFTDDLNALRFQSDGRLLVDYFDEETQRRQVEESSYKLGKKLHVSVLVNRRAETFCASIDGAPENCVQLGGGPPSHLKFGLASIDGPGAVGIDNVTVVGWEPSR